MNTNKKIIKSIINKTLNMERVFQLLIALILYIITLVLVFPTYMQKITIPSIGETVKEPLIAKSNIKYKNVEETQRLITYLQANVRPIFEMPESIQKESLLKVSNMFNFIGSFDTNNVSLDEMYEAITSKYSLNINKTIFSNAIVNKDNIGYEAKVVDTLKSLFEVGIISKRNLTPETLRLILNNGIFIYKYNDYVVEERIAAKNRIFFLENLKNEISSILGNRYNDLNVFHINTISSIINVFLVDNLIYNSEKTQEEINKIQLSVEPIYTTIKAGFPILEEGERVTEDKVKLLKYILDNSSFFEYNIRNLIGQGLFILMLFAFVGYIIFKYKIEFYTNFKNFILFSLEYLLIISIAYFISNYVSDKLINIPFYIYTFIPMFSMLNTLLGARRGISAIVTVCITLLAANMVQADVYEFFSLFVISMITSIATKKINNRNGVLWLGIQIGVSLSIVSLINAFIADDFSFNYMIFVFAFASGLIQAILVMIILPICEYLLETATIFRLQELADLNNPLLRQLQINAPGTYHHSINMANLVEAIADEIGEDGRLACVSAYYHDIGKIENPLYFIENTNKNDNRHNKLKPTLSAAIVKSHVRFGVEIAKKYRLPKEIIAAIKEHHGTSLIKYFYADALKEDPDIDVSLFTYGGPKPQSKITAILMILDSIEAASRTIDNPTKEKLSSLIDSIVKSKMTEGELNDSGLTLQDIETIKRISLQKILISLHERIKYPELPKDIGKDNNKNEKTEKAENTEKNTKTDIKKVSKTKERFIKNDGIKKDAVNKDKVKK
ncbi:HDIG domain-containing metalloprotein [uncultured Brachyspira sp.]|uniref:HD family phosphohydrolase n=1 Tax=uncultured Brachyspira sp. TaxID=221953 RepID=UPI002604E7F6|nr:HDIG domain-containing metalloprotein [uncultured Brachyspira sp.]